MNTLKTLKSGLNVSAVTLLLAACLGDAAYPGYEKSPTGLYSKFFVRNETARQLKTGEVAAVSLSYYNDKDSMIFNSASIKESDHGIISQPVFGSSFKGSLEEALTTMKEGDSASFKISADSVYFKTFRVKELPKYIAKGSMLTFYVKLHSVKTQEELLNEMSQKEKKDLERFIQQNNISVSPTESGLYIVTMQEGTGKEIAEGQTASVKYSGKFLNGQVFDATDMHDGKPIDVSVGKGQVIPGWEEALLKMKKGQKVLLVVPSALGYGSQGMGHIPPYSPLLFEMEIVDIK
ncbi:MAG: FKBP-type peptidyl-prolyl cis-trans isomerase [Bacteroidia bacterium]|nr:FKBP-type peptidyl-prolyl cis-trans isomerase [Bacteroidia bacterium]